MGGVILKAVLMWCFVALVFVACSEEPNRPDRGETDPAPRRTLAQSTVSGNTVVQGTVASGYVEDEGVLSVEEAQLQRGQKEQGDQIVVQAAVRGRTHERGCFLMEGSDWLALKRLIDSGAVLPDCPRQAENLWAEQSPADEFSGGNMYVGIFHEDPKPDGDEANPKKTPFFAFCYKDADPGGSSGPTAWYDVAHVEGTPEA
jgi:hypothetical protein